MDETLCEPAHETEEKREPCCFGECSRSCLMFVSDRVAIAPMMGEAKELPTAELGVSQGPASSDLS